MYGNAGFNSLKVNIKAMAVHHTQVCSSS